MKKILFSILAIATIWSCGKDDSPETPTPPTPTETENSVPVIATKTFTVAETISDTEVIGKVTATDADDDALTFSIATNSDALFEITAAGDLSLASGKTLDAATKEQHAITVKVDDGEDTANATITIKVTAVTPTNQAPEMADQEFTPKEDIADTDEIGQVMATDADEDDTLTFELTVNDNELFAVSESGVITLAEGKTLDYETAPSHSITVSVTDGEETVEATITISVENVYETLAENPDSFITTWQVEDGSQFNRMLDIGVNTNYSYAFTVDWGDGNVEDFTFQGEQYFEHEYEKGGVYTVAILGDFPAIKMEYSSTKSKNYLISLDQWGNQVWQTFNEAFKYCAMMEYKAEDIPDLSEVENMAFMFFEAALVNGDFSGWDTSNITDMTYSFAYATSFNSDISGWQTGNVTTMEDMFIGATSFNQYLGDWYIGKVELMENMFYGTVMTPVNMSDTLIAWEAADNIPVNITLNISNIDLCESAGDAYSSLTSNPYNWSIDFGFSVNCN